MKNDRNDTVHELITRYLAGEASVVEEKAVLSWIEESPENAREYEQLKKVFDKTTIHYQAQSKGTGNIDVDREWDVFLETIGQGKMRKLNEPRTGQWSFMKIAAAILVLAVSAWMIYYFASKDSTTVYNSVAEVRTVELPDGSRVVLNRHSELTVSAAFGENQRIVSLKGEAFFDVVSDKQRPFIIQARDVQVEVLGTSFSVQAYDSVKNIEVIVETGTVRVSVPSRQKQVQLVAGQKAVFEKATEQIATSVNQDINYLSWNTQKIVFVDQDLREVIRTVSKTYGTNILIETDIPETCMVTVTFDAQSLDAVLHVLESTLNLTYERRGNLIIITRAAC